MKRISNRGQGSIVLLTVLGVAILFVTIIGATFAYFSVNLKLTNSLKSVTIKSKMLVVEFASTNSIYYDRVIPGRPEWGEDEKPTNKLSFTLTSPTDMLAKNAYDVYLNIDTNNFVTDNMVFYLKENECVRKDNTGSTLGYLYSDKTLEFDYDGEIVNLGVIPAGYVGRLKISEGAILGGLGCVDSWDFELWLKETGVEQNEDQTRTLKASIEIETGTLYPVDYEI